MKRLNYQLIKHSVLSKGYIWYTGEYELNYVGIRNEDDRDSNGFTDHLYLAFIQNGVEECLCFQGTTDPGLAARKQPSNPKGVAMVVPDQYIDLYVIGKHRGQYEALVQNKMISVYRINCLSGQLNPTEDTLIETGFFGINTHGTQVASPGMIVDRWSEGCQVVGLWKDYLYFMATVNRCLTETMKPLTYTLLLSSDIKTREEVLKEALVAERPYLHDSIFNSDLVNNQQPKKGIGNYYAETIDDDNPTIDISFKPDIVNKKPQSAWKRFWSKIFK